MTHGAGRHGDAVAAALLSLLLHACLLFWSRQHAAPPAGPPDDGRTVSIPVWIRPLPNAPGPTAFVAPTDAGAARQRAQRRLRDQPVSAAPVPDPADPPVEAQAGHSADTGAAPHLDRDAILGVARKLDATPDRSGNAAPVAQLQRKPLYGPEPETRFARQMGETARPDCKNIASATGLFALLIVPAHILFDKKDSGCKW